MPRPARGAGAAVGAGLVGLAAANRVRRERRARRIAGAVPGAHGLAATSVWIGSTAGPRLHAWWAQADAAVAPAVLVAHGYASHAGDLLPMAGPLRDAGFHVLLLDVRGHGRSDPWDGRPSPPVFAEDLGAGLDWLGERADVSGVALLGHSMGGSAAIVLASERDDVAALVTVAAVADPTLTNLGWWPAALNRRLIPVMARRLGRDPTEAFARNRIGRVDAPVLLVHGGRDRIVPIAHMEALADADPEARTLVLPEAGHTRVDAFAPAIDPVLEFLRDVLLPRD